jgi:hypothetical protein
METRAAAQAAVSSAQADLAATEGRLTRTTKAPTGREAFRGSTLLPTSPAASPAAAVLQAPPRLTFPMQRR